jgi:hypothetical protein
MITNCKQRLPLPELLVHLGLFDRTPNPGNHPYPLNGEQHGAALAMTFKRGSWVWKCHGKCATGGDERSLLQTYFNLFLIDAIRNPSSRIRLSPDADD